MCVMRVLFMEARTSKTAGSHLSISAREFVPVSVLPLGRPASIVRGHEEGLTQGYLRLIETGRSSHYLPSPLAGAWGRTCLLTLWLMPVVSRAPGRRPRFHHHRHTTGCWRRYGPGYDMRARSSCRKMVLPPDPEIFTKNAPVRFCIRTLRTPCMGTHPVLNRASRMRAHRLAPILESLTSGNICTHAVVASPGLRLNNWDCRWASSAPTNSILVGWTSWTIEISPEFVCLGALLPSPRAGRPAPVIRCCVTKSPANWTQVSGFNASPYIISGRRPAQLIRKTCVPERPPPPTDLVNINHRHSSSLTVSGGICRCHSSLLRLGEHTML